MKRINSVLGIGVLTAAVVAAVSSNASAAVCMEASAPITNLRSDVVDAVIANGYLYTLAGTGTNKAVQRCENSTGITKCVTVATGTAIASAFVKGRDYSLFIHHGAQYGGGQYTTERWDTYNGSVKTIYPAQIQSTAMCAPSSLVSGSFSNPYLNDIRQNMQIVDVNGGATWSSDEFRGEELECPTAGYIAALDRNGGKIVVRIGGGPPGVRYLTINNAEVSGVQTFTGGWNAGEPLTYLYTKTNASNAIHLWTSSNYTNGTAQLLPISPGYNVNLVKFIGGNKNTFSFINQNADGTRSARFFSCTW